MSYDNKKLQMWIKKKLTQKLKTINFNNITENEVNTHEQAFVWQFSGINLLCYYFDLLKKSSHIMQNSLYDGFSKTI